MESPMDGAQAFSVCIVTHNSVWDIGDCLQVVIF
jgi:hypothetical protein